MVAFFLSISIVWANGWTPSITDIQKMLEQYAKRVEVLEAENAVLREAVARAGVKIPLSAYSGAIKSEKPITNRTPATNIINTSSTNVANALQKVETTYGTMYAWFIGRMMKEWDKVRPAYKMPKGATIGGYEFVETGNLNNVFVDIIYTGSSLSGSYDAKLLYRFNKDTYVRTLVGFFELDHKTGYYITRTGSNPFAKVKRLFIPGIRSTQTQILTPQKTENTPQKTDANNVTSPQKPNTTVNQGSVSIADIKKAYADKKYLSVITLSDTWLANNTANLEVLQIRYRVYFAIAKYKEALAEIKKVQTIGQLNSSVACEAYVIASYAKNTIEMNNYKPLCK